MQVKGLLATQTQLVGRVKTLEELVLTLQQQLASLHQSVHGEPPASNHAPRHRAGPAAANHHPHPHPAAVAGNASTTTAKLVSLDSDELESVRTARRPPDRAAAGWAQGGFGGDAAFPT